MVKFIKVTFLVAFALHLINPNLSKGQKKSEVEFTISDIKLLTDKHAMMGAGADRALRIYNEEKLKIVSFVAADHNERFSNVIDSLIAFATDTKSIDEIKKLDNILREANYNQKQADLKIDLIENLQLTIVEFLDQHTLKFFESRKKILNKSVDIQKFLDEKDKKEEILKKLKMQLKESAKYYEDFIAVFREKYKDTKFSQHFMSMELLQKTSDAEALVDSLKQNLELLNSREDKLQIIRNIGSIFYLTASSIYDQIDIRISEVSYDLKESSRNMSRARDMIVMQRSIKIHENSKPFLVEATYDEDESEKDQDLEDLKKLSKIK